MARSKSEKTDDSASSTISAKVILDRYEQGLQATLFERQQYWINYAFLRGRQWVYWNKTTRRIDDLARTRGRYQATIDRISPSSRTLMSKATERELVFDVLPSGADDSSIMGARTAESVLRTLHREQEWESIREELAWGTWTGGTAALCIDWDIYAGKEIKTGSETDDRINTGDVCVSALTMPEFVLQPGARKDDDALWWCKAVVLPSQTVQSMWPDKFEKAPPSDAQSSHSPYNQRVVTEESSNTKDGTIVLTYYERPNALNKKGTVAVVVDNKIVENREWPFPWTDRLNLVVVRETPVNGRWTGDTMLSKAIKIQSALNAAWSNYLEHLKKVGNARLLIPASQMESVDSLVDDPGKPIKFMDGPGAQLPQYLQPPQLPSWVRDIIGELRNEMDTVTGVTDVSRGMAPSNAPDSGYGFEILNDNANTPIGRLTKDQSRAFGRIASMVLRLYERNVKETHTAIVHMPRQPPMTVKWTGKSLAGQTTAIVPLDAIMPRSGAASQQFAQTAMKMGFIRPGDIVTFARIAELPGAENVIEAVDVQASLAQRYCAYIAEGIVPQPEPWHDSQVMIDTINRFRCTPKYEGLKPEIKELYEITVQAYDTMAKEQAGQRQAELALNPVLAMTPDKNGAPPISLPELPGAPPAPGIGDQPLQEGLDVEQPQLPLAGG